jgi:hypothetical protein
VVGDDERVGPDPLKRRRRGIDAEAELVDPARLDPLGELPVHRRRLLPLHQQEVGLEDRVETYELQQLLEIHSGDANRMDGFHQSTQPTLKDDRKSRTTGLKYTREPWRSPHRD